MRNNFLDLRVTRGGRRGNSMTVEPQDKWATRWWVEPDREREVNLRFFLKSKGGGETKVRVELSAADVTAMFLQLLSAGQVSDESVIEVIRTALAYKTERNTRDEKI